MSPAKAARGPAPRASPGPASQSRGALPAQPALACRELPVLPSMLRLPQWTLAASRCKATLKFGLGELGAMRLRANKPRNTSRRRALSPDPPLRHGTGSRYPCGRLRLRLRVPRCEEEKNEISMARSRGTMRWSALCVTIFTSRPDPALGTPRTYTCARAMTQHRQLSLVAGARIISHSATAKS